MSERLRVCHVAMGDLWAGAEVQLATLIRYLRKDQRLSLSVVLFNEGKLADELRKLSIPVRVIEESRVGFFGLIRQLIVWFKEFRPHIIHTHKYKDNIAASLASWVVGGVSVVRMVHGLPEPFRGLKGLNMKAYVLLDGFISRWRVGRFVAVSENVKVALTKQYSADHVVCIHNGVDLESLQYDERKRDDVRFRLGFGREDIVVGAVGRLSPVKAPDRLVRAAKQLIQDGYRVRVLLVGDGPMQHELRHLVSELNLDLHVVFAGHQEHVPDYLCAMDIFALSSLHEGIPMALLEAMALGRPVVATHVGGIPEVIQHGVCGLLVQSGDDVALSNALRDLIEHAEKSMLLGRAGRARVEQEFSAARMAERTSAMYLGLRIPIPQTVSS